MMDTDAFIHWPGGSVPLDKPDCGFAGEAPECQPRGKNIQPVTELNISLVLS